MAARVCPTCKRGWPASTEYTQCPVCERSTNYLLGALAMSSDECEATLALLASVTVELEDAETIARYRGRSWSVVDILLETPMLEM